MMQETQFPKMWDKPLKGGAYPPSQQSDPQHRHKVLLIGVFLLSNAPHKIRCCG
jgi:hypothetical protein